MKNIILSFALVMILINPNFVEARTTAEKIHDNSTKEKLSNTQLETGREYARKMDRANAEKYFNLAITTNPKNAQAYCAYALLKSRIGDTKSALAYYSKSIEMDRSNDNYYLQRGLEYMSINKIESAMNDFNKAIELNKNNSVAYMSRGALRVMWGDFKNALDDFDKSLQCTNSFADTDIPYSTRAELKVYLMDYEGAIKDYKTAITKAKQNNNQESVKEYTKRLELIKEAKKVFLK